MDAIQWKAAIGGAALAWGCAAMAQPVTSYRGICDASAAVALDAAHFVVADDERNTLMVYRRGEPEPVGRLDLARFLRTGDGQESDIEGAAVIGKRIYWISSHGRNSKGRKRDERQRLFATDIVAGTSPPALKPVGEPYTRLLKDLFDAPQLKKYHLKEAAGLPPEATGGLNIEGLAATPDGALLIGLRNPLSQGRALVVAIDNPAAAIEGQRARIGAVSELALDGRGIRSLERTGSGYLVVAGPTGDEGRFALYRWSGVAGQAPALRPDVDFKTLRPEALFVLPDSQDVQLLSDDGGVKTAGVECKALPVAQRSFRSITVRP